jgi:hypothetical protein
MSDHDELKMQLSTGVCFLFINFFFLTSQSVLLRLKTVKFTGL